MKKALLLLALASSFNVFAGVKECVLSAWDNPMVVERDKAMMKCFSSAKREFTTVEQCLWISNEVTSVANQDEVKAKCASMFEARMSFDACLAVANSVDSQVAQDSVKYSCMKASNKTLSARACLGAARTMNASGSINAATELCLGDARADLNMSSCITEADEVAGDDLSDDLKIKCVKIYGVKNGVVTCTQAMEAGDTVAPRVSQRACCLKVVTELYLNANKSKLERKCDDL